MNELIVSEVQIILVKPKDGLIAFASCVINNQFYCGNLAIYTSPSSSDGYRLVYPSKITSTGKQIQCIHPITREAGEIVKKAIIDKYLEVLEKVQV